jgi:methionyl-tRNA synthetase
VIGYLSATKEWAQRSGDADKWKDFWQKDSRAYYFMGKDNIPFHTVIWPSMLMAYGDLNLPYDVPANEYVNLEREQVSTSRDWAVWMPDYLDRYDVDSIRYMLASIMPETSDSDFNWAEFVRRNNDELVATFGNLVHRVLTMAGRNFDHTTPDPGDLDEESKELLEEAGRGFEAVSSELERCRFRNALQSAMGIARSANRYLDSKAPWRAVRTDKDDAARTLWTAMTVINCLKTAFFPFMPETSEKLHGMLGLDGSAEAEGWSWNREALAPGSALPRPKPLFTKLDDSIIEEERSRLGA